MVKLMKEIHRLMRNIGRLSDKQATAKLADSAVEGAVKLIITITPNGGLYRNGTFDFEVTLKEYEYPDCPPVIVCLTQIYHPNIDTTDMGSDEDYEDPNSNVCLNLIDSGVWNSKFGLEGIVLGLIFLFYHPNLEDPLSPHFDGRVDDDVFENEVKCYMAGEPLEDGTTFNKKFKVIDGIRVEEATKTHGNDNSANENVRKEDENNITNAEKTELVSANNAVVHDMTNSTVSTATSETVNAITISTEDITAENDNSASAETGHDCSASASHSGVDSGMTNDVNNDTSGASKAEITSDDKSEHFEKDLVADINNECSDKNETEQSAGGKDGNKNTGPNDTSEDQKVDEQNTEDQDDDDDDNDVDDLSSLCMICVNGESVLLFGNSNEVTQEQTVGELNNANIDIMASKTNDVTTPIDNDIIDRVEVEEEKRDAEIRCENSNLLTESDCMDDKTLNIAKKGSRTYKTRLKCGFWTALKASFAKLFTHFLSRELNNDIVL